MTIGERFQAVRKAIQEQSGEKYTQKQMSETLGISRDSLANIENDRNPPTPPVIQLLCERHNVSEAWLRTGEGEMFKPLKQQAEIERLFKEVLTEPRDNGEQFRKALINAIARIPSDRWGDIADTFELIAMLYNDEKNGK